MCANMPDLYQMIACCRLVHPQIDTKIKGLPSNFSVTTTPVVFFGNLRSKISSLFKFLIEIFKLSTLTYLLVSGSESGNPAFTPVSGSLTQIQSWEKKRREVINNFDKFSVKGKYDFDDIQNAISKKKFLK